MRVRCPWRLPQPRFGRSAAFRINRIPAISLRAVQENDLQREMAIHRSEHDYAVAGEAHRAACASNAQCCDACVMCAVPCRAVPRC